MRPRVEDDRRVLHRPTSVSKATVGAWLTHRTHSTPRILAPSPKRSIKREQDTSAQRRPLRPAASHLAAAVSTKVQGPLYSGPRVDGDERGSRQRARQKAGGPVAQQDEAQGGEDAWTLTLGFDELSWPSPGRLVGSAALGSPPPAPTWPQRHGWPRRRLTCRRGPALRRVLAAPSEAVGHGHRPGTGRYAFRIWKPLGQVITETAKKISAPTFSSYYKGGFEQKMSRREASLILGVSPSAGKAKIRAAHRRIMILNHPDKGQVYALL
ncbi:dnaJ homolog subfamily C member 15 isoform X2 [Phacochoerus africanus]|uniref:dnaJ homolog subfamily C member 15 isoform X2 n=1 Tax=Phacochoerus africanus TaxID=41426 RepID=UPI001FD8EA2C|nr:dnaJ homolog subfamily C member 15 isoform X2 [Phacochoerus africanus]